MTRLGIHRKVVARCRQYQSACKLVMQEGLLLTMPRRVAEAVNVMDEGTLLKPPIALPPVRLHLYWHRSRDTDAANAWLRNTITEAMK